MSHVNFKKGLCRCVKFISQQSLDQSYILCAESPALQSAQHRDHGKSPLLSVLTQSLVEIIGALNS